MTTAEKGHGNDCTPPQRVALGPGRSLALASLRVSDDTTPTQPDHVYVEPSSAGIEVIADTPDGQVIVHVPWDKAVELSRRILQLARDHGDVRCPRDVCGGLTPTLTPTLRS